MEPVLKKTNLITTYRHSKSINWLLNRNKNAQIRTANILVPTNISELTESNTLNQFYVHIHQHPKLVTFSGQDTESICPGTGSCNSNFCLCNKGTTQAQTSGHPKFIHPYKFRNTYHFRAANLWFRTLQNFPCIPTSINSLRFCRTTSAPALPQNTTSSSPPAALHVPLHLGYHSPSHSQHHISSMKTPYRHSLSSQYVFCFLPLQH